MYGGTSRHGSPPFHQNQRGAVLIGQAVDHSAHTAAHLVDNQPFIDRRLGIRTTCRLIDLDDFCFTLGFSQMIRCNAGGDRECPRFDTRAAGEVGTAAIDPSQRLLEKIFGRYRITDIPSKVAPKIRGEVVNEFRERSVRERSGDI
jgi:hypothetical protein